MITATGKKEPYITELTDGIHLFSADTPLADGGSGLHQRPTDILISVCCWTRSPCPMTVW